MQTNLADFIRDTSDGRAAESILRKCVHCGFCTATCPTYQLLGDELDGPRGRIYLIKQVLEGHTATATTRQHLDRCLTCRNCETTCPSGVDYGHLVDIGRNVVEQQAPRPFIERLFRGALRTTLANESLFGTLHQVGTQLEPLLPKKLAELVHKPESPGIWPQPRHARRMIVLRGCVQPSLAPRINAAAARVLDTLGISLMEPREQTCCGAVEQHTNAPKAALQRMRRNVDIFCKALDDGAEAIVMTASGCGAMVRDYAHLLRDDPHYAARAQRVVEHTRDLAEVIRDEAITDVMAWPGRTSSGLPPSVHTATRTEVDGSRRRATRESGRAADPCAGRAYLLRLRWRVFDLATGTVQSTADAQIGASGSGRAGTDSDGQYRLLASPAGRHSQAGTPLDRVSGRRFAGKRLTPTKDCRRAVTAPSVCAAIHSRAF